MSNLAAMIEEEERKADEPELTPDEQEAEEEQQGDEPELAPAPGEPPSDVQAEVTLGKLDREAARYGKAVAKIIEGSLIAPNPCPLCVFPGLVFDFNPHNGDDQMRKAAVDEFFGQAGPEYKVATDAERCATCDGYGLVLTGSQSDNFVTKACIMCSGQGWVTKTSTQPLYAVAPSAPYPGAEVTFTPPPSGIPDAWNRPAGHPHWGIDPSLIGA